MDKERRVIDPINASFDDVVGAMTPPAQKSSKIASDTKSKKDERQTSFDFEMVEYDPSESEVSVGLRIDQSTKEIWATQSEIASLFETSQSNISQHLKNIFEEGELDQDSNIRKSNIASSAKPVALYSLDVIISVGYRVSSSKATKFRQWATTTLRAYIEQGYVVNEQALRDDPSKLNKLAATIRALRSEEKQVYAKVRECFKLGASDYDPSSKEVRKFYSLLQDKFHHAVTKMTASKLIMDRADHKEENMGMAVFSGNRVTTTDAKTGKNYLTPDELYRLHLLSEQFLLYAESTALAGKKMTMQSLHNQLDRLLQLNDYPVFDGYKDYLKDKAERHAKQELTLYKKRLKIEQMGIEYDEEALALGEYDHILISN